MMKGLKDSYAVSVIFTEDVGHMKARIHTFHIVEVCEFDEHDARLRWANATMCVAGTARVHQSHI